MKKVIFDVDGVLLSEKRYFDVSALTVWEWFYSPSYMRLGHEDVKPDLSNAEIDSIRARIWYDDKILTWLKQHGVNNNWDMVHARIVVTLWLMMEEYVNDHGRANTQIKSIDDVQYLKAPPPRLYTAVGRCSLSAHGFCRSGPGEQRRSLYVLNESCRIVFRQSFDPVDTAPVAVVAASF